MDQLKSMQDTLVTVVEGEMSHLDRVDYQELGGAIDMIKDLSEAIYYCTITEAMNKPQHRYYMPIPYYQDDNRDIDRDKGRMYYVGREGARTGHPDNYVPSHGIRDYREGMSPISRKMYMESKEMHHPKEKQLKDLEQYMHELGQDITEMISEASIEEKQMLHKKLTDLASKLHV